MRDEIRVHYTEHKGRYFEGWYYKCKSEQVKNLAIILGVSHHEDEQQAFIQVVHHSAIGGGYYTFPFSEFSFQQNPFLVRIGRNYCTKEEVYVEIEEVDGHPAIHLQLFFRDQVPLPRSLFHPTIMGPLLYLPYLPCYHHIIALQSQVDGYLMTQQGKTTLVGQGYIEKDYGSSFPTGYIWSQGSSEDAMFVVALAMVPFFKMEQLGFFAVFKKGDKIYRFSTYQLGRIRRCSKYGNRLYIEIEQFLDQISIMIEYQDKVVLRSPKQGKMEDLVEEHLNCQVNVVIETHHRVVFEENFELCVSEIFEFDKLVFKQ